MDSDLPDLPSSPPHLPIQTKKRPLDPEFQSDGPTFSSDPLEPAIDLNRRKRQHKGTWWAHGNDRISKSSLSRNFDSGIYLPSDSSEDFIPKENVGFGTNSYKSHKLERPSLPNDPLNSAADTIVNNVVETSGETVDMAGIGFTRLKNSVFKPLNSIIKLPRFMDKSTSGENTSDEDVYQSLEPELQFFLSNNSLSTLPASTWSVHCLTVLSLRNNCLINLPGSISKLINLRELNLSNNNLRWLPWELLSLLGPDKRLKKLFVSNNPLIKGVNLDNHLRGKKDWMFPQSLSDFQLTMKSLQEEIISDSDSAAWLLKLMKEFWKMMKKNGDIERSIENQSDSENESEEDIPALESFTHNTMLVASTNVSLFHKDGSTARPGPMHPMPPSKIPSSITYLKAFTNIVSKSFGIQESGAPSLLELAISSCAKHPGVDISEMLSYLSSETPEPVLRALRVAGEAQSEGGRICSVCGRNYIIPRTEWIEFWHWVPENPMVINEDEMFWPFLRRGCSTVCIP